MKTGEVIELRFGDIVVHAKVESVTGAETPDRDAIHRDTAKTIKTILTVLERVGRNRMTVVELATEMQTEEGFKLQALAAIKERVIRLLVKPWALIDDIGLRLMWETKDGRSTPFVELI